MTAPAGAVKPARIARSHAAALLVGAAIALASAAGAAAASLALVGGTLHPVSGPSLVGTIYIVEGRISGIGTSVPVPAGTPTLDVTGLDVYPGLFDALSTLGLVEISSIAATDDSSELGRFNPHLVAATAVNPASEVLPVTRSNGITHTLTAPQMGSDGIIGGQASLIHLAGWTVEDMLLERSAAMMVAWPAIETNSFDPATFRPVETAYSVAKKQAEERATELRDWLAAARHYAQAKSSGSQRVEPNLKLEELARVLDGGLPTIVLADRVRDIEAALDLAQEHGLDLVLAGAREAWRVKERLAELQVPVILGPTQDLPAQEDDPYDRPFRTAGELVAAGVRIAFSSGASAGPGGGPLGPHDARTLPYEAANAVAYGLPWEEAIKAITLYPAQILGVDEHLGSLEPGKVANLIVTDGDPLSLRTEVRQVIVRGQPVGTGDRHLELYERYRARSASGQK